MPPGTTGRPRAGGVASDLFGGEEGGGPWLGSRAGAEGGQADAGQAGPAVGGDQDAARAQVEVDQAGGVGRLQGVEQLEAELGHPADRQRAVPGDQLVQGEGVGQLTDHVDDAVLDDHVLQPDQARMLEGGRRPHLGRDPLPELLLRPTGTGRDSSRSSSTVTWWPLESVARQNRPRCARRSGLQRPAARDEPLAGVG